LSAATQDPRSNTGVPAGHSHRGTHGPVHCGLGSAQVASHAAPHVLHSFPPAHTSFSSEATPVVVEVVDDVLLSGAAVDDVLLGASVLLSGASVVDVVLSGAAVDHALPGTIR
jgi:hypothetical protein